MASTVSKLEGLIPSASEIRQATGWESWMIEDYLSILRNINLIAESSDTNASQIEALETSISELQAAVSSNTSSISSNTQQIDTLNQSVTSLQNSVSDLSEEIAGGCYLSSSKTVAVSAVDEWYAIGVSAGWNDADLSNFSHSNGVLQYIGANDTKAITKGQIQAGASTGSAQVAIVKNWTPVGGGTLSDPSGIFSLSQNDTLQIIVTNTRDTEDIVVTAASLIAVRV